MFYRISAAIILITCSSLSVAENNQPLDLDDPKPLIMQPGYNLDTDFTEQNNSQLLDTGKKSEGDELTERCAKLKQEYDNLKGKPQRRWAVKERYKAECQAYFDLHQ